MNAFLSHEPKTQGSFSPTTFCSRGNLVVEERCNRRGYCRMTGGVYCN